MKLPFVEEIPTFSPRKRPGIDPQLTPFEVQVLDAIDVGEQRDEFNTRIAVRAHNIAVVVAILLVLVDGPQVLVYVQRFLSPQPAHAAAVHLTGK